MEHKNKKKGLSDDTIDVITVLILFASVLFGAVYYLNGMPG